MANEKYLEKINYNGTDYILGKDVMNGASNNAAGTLGLVPAPAAGDQASFLRGDGTWAAAQTVSGTTPITVGSPNANNIVTISHATSGATADTYGVLATDALTPDFGSTFSVPGFTVNATGHITAAGAHTVAIPANTAIAPGSMSSSDPGSNGLMTAQDKADIEALVSINTATSESYGYMSAADKSALDSLVTQTNSLDENISSLIDITTLKNSDGTTASTSVPIPLNNLYWTVNDLQTIVTEIQNKTANLDLDTNDQTVISNGSDGNTQVTIDNTGLVITDPQNNIIADFTKNPVEIPNLAVTTLQTEAHELKKTNNVEVSVLLAGGTTKTPGTAWVWIGDLEE